MTTRTILFLIISGTWAGIHLLALQTQLYWYYWWFDIPMHFFGGAVVALGLFVAIDLGVRLLRRFTGFRAVLLYVLIVAVIWELYELGIGIPMLSDFWLDTSIDIVMGLLGGIAGYKLAVSLENNL